MTPSTGGYLLHKTPLIRTGHCSHTSALDKPVSELDLRALNTVQSTPWRVNQWVLDVMLEAQDLGLPLGGLEVGDRPQLPDRLPDTTWAAMSPVDRKGRAAVMQDIHARRATHDGRSRALADKLGVAEELRDVEAFYYPHSRCFRGRIYPVATSGPHPQGDDIGKGLLEFARGLPLGEDGLFWLLVRAANCYGKDKLDLVDRVQWSLDHQDAMREAVEDPLQGGWWASASEPWSFLATCREVVLALEQPTEFVSHLPVPQDGSCNGLQHLSAMGLDPVGAKATNLVQGPRQDIYEDVAVLVRKQVEADAALGKPEALIWYGRVTRDVCKRSVMTTPYGVTDRGIRMQLLADGAVPEEAEDKGAAADYMRDCLIAALGVTIEAGRGIMAWLQMVADRLARAGLPFDWTSPSGSRCRQAYYGTSRREVETLVGRMMLEEEVAGDLAPRKAALGAAPNYVHAADAAHLALTVVAAAEEGMTDFAMIHDSFGTHACNTTRLATILREQFIAIYRKDWLDEVYRDVTTTFPHVDICPPPERGEFDIEEVLDAQFFFS